MRTQLTAEFTALANTEGTFQNTSRHAAIEIATSTTKNTGIILNAQEAKNIKSDATLYARVIEDISDNTETVYLAHEPFKGAEEGGDSRDSRKPSTAYDVGALVDGAGLEPGLALRCTTAGTTSASALDCSGYGLGDTITDGTATWLVTEYVTLDANGGISTNIYIPGAFNKKETFTSSGSYTAPVTGVYRITLQGGGGGGGGAGTGSTVLAYSGGGGGAGGTLEFYEHLVAGQSYSYIIGAGGTGGATGTDGTSGGNSSITINNNEYISYGGEHGYSILSASCSGGRGGDGLINGFSISRGIPGGNGQRLNVSPTISLPGGMGGGYGGGRGETISLFGGGGAGGAFTAPSTIAASKNGGDGYITFEYYDTNA